ncbi:DUF349 domain-containing protein [Algoriphagus kandeliae]|uniref:DUF349 domain-containing protein n=1 Tax=Algoriphagus kandeliae TaxID=2562278 RepID=A0A4Y9QZ17_9BACT|nr:DUF349 domain-containing protein [Algoriphagus kandeliae]TFV97659.1 DUF349 domain-containing protein [Algoriphagus kandeliae]
MTDQSKETSQEDKVTQASENIEATGKKEEKVETNSSKAETEESAKFSEEPEKVEETQNEAVEVSDSVEKEESEEVKAHDTDSDAVAGSQDDSSSDEEEEHEEDDHDSEEELDLEGLSKSALVKLIKEKTLHASNLLKIERIVNEIKNAFDEITHKERDEALEKFKAEGGAEDDFDFRPSDDEREFNKYYYEYKTRVSGIRKEAEKAKERNLELKNEILDKLRELVDGEETTLSMNAIKAIQQEWKSIGPVPASQNRNLWASYNALMDRFYDNRSIYFELKELDRKKNLESKMELCEKAEALKDVSDLKEAIKALNELHEEFKHIGPVPREEQEPLWQRFKAASDAIYDRRKVYYDSQKEVFKKNQDEKEALIEKLKGFLEFKGDRIKDWNTKTKEILEIQKAWEKIGPVPREKGREINKAFWSSFKQFFSHKNQFFKELDEIRATNAAKAEELIQKAEGLKESTEWQSTANEMIKLQQEWKKLGPMPEKNRDSLYKRFKGACDYFFDSRRNANKQANSEYEDNYKKKIELCEQIEKAASGNPSEEEITEFVQQFNEIGFVPRKNMKEVQNKFKAAVDVYLEKLSEDFNREDFLFRLNLNRIQGDPNATRTMNKKEHGIRKQISDLENNITLWKNNLEFFAASKTADKLKDQFDAKIQKAEEEIEKLKKKLSILREF